MTLLVSAYLHPVCTWAIHKFVRSDNLMLLPSVLIMLSVKSNLQRHLPLMEMWWLWRVFWYDIFLKNVEQHSWQREGLANIHCCQEDISHMTVKKYWALQALVQCLDSFSKILFNVEFPLQVPKPLMPDSKLFWNQWSYGHVVLALLTVAFLWDRYDKWLCLFFVLQDLLIQCDRAFQYCDKRNWDKTKMITFSRGKIRNQFLYIK